MLLVISIYYELPLFKEMLHTSMVSVNLIKVSPFKTKKYSDETPEIT